MYFTNKIQNYHSNMKYFILCIRKIISIYSVTFYHKTKNVLFKKKKIVHYESDVNECTDKNDKDFRDLNRFTQLKYYKL